MSNLSSKLPDAGTSIFAVMSALAQQHNAINLAQGFPNFEPPQRLKDLVGQAIQDGYNQYAPMPGLPMLREAIANKIQLTYGVRPDPGSEVTVTAGATQALFCAIQAVVHPGDEVILLEPAYDCYLPAVLLAGGVPISVPLKGPEFTVDWDEVRAKVTSCTRLIITNNPHNPLGKVFRAPDMAALKDIVLQHDLLLLSDEVYEHLVFDGLPHLSVMADAELFARSMVTFSFGKTFHATGWKTGYVVAPPNLTVEYRKVHQFNVFSVHTPSQVALARFMEDPASWSDLNDFYQAKRDHLTRELAGSPFHVLPCEGTYFGLLDYSGMSDEDDITFARNYTERCGVALIPISPFYRTPPTENRTVRVCFAKTEDVLSDAARQMRTAVY
ncbi:MAG: aminotransferase class I/II-fold pyridoxal phosphate-dependent enzyme [Saprospiraceae bacterium]|nr:aminotransferase class I/II-fold pyridoxal phosphate-dependent enzyme [Saprospiraceae bacterium]